MIDIKALIANPKEFKDAIKLRGLDENIIDEIMILDKKRRELTAFSDELKCQRNEHSKSVGLMKAKGEDATQLMLSTKALGDKIAKIDEELDDIKQRLEANFLVIPNLPLHDVPIGSSEKDNVHIKIAGSPRRFAFTPKPHWDLGSDLDILDNVRASKLSGARFNLFKGDLAKLQRALISFMVDLHTQKHGFYEVFTPVLATTKTCQGTGQLPKFAADMYKIENEELFLISTNEITLVNMHSDEVLHGFDLPIRYTGYALCFRKEAGAAGRDTRGLIRVHQFEKVEMVTFCKPEQSENELQHLVKSASDVLENLELPYRVSLMCTGDMSGFSAAKSYDLEVWMPSYNDYLEVSSCSNCTDFQARRSAIRFKNAQGESAKFVHTLNGSGLAIGRTMAAVMENYQNENGTIQVPRALIPYMGTDVIGSKNT